MKRKIDILDVLTITVVAGVLLGATAWVNVGQSGGQSVDTTLTPPIAYGVDESTPADGVFLYSSEQHYAGGPSALSYLNDQGTSGSFGEDVEVPGDVYLNPNGTAGDVSIYAKGATSVTARIFWNNASTRWQIANNTQVGAQFFASADVVAGGGLGIGGTGLATATDDTAHFLGNLTAEPTDPAVGDMLQYVLIEATDDFGSSPAMVLAHDDEGTTGGAFQGGKLWFPQVIARDQLMIPTGTTVPTAPAVGSLFYDSDEGGSGTLKLYNADNQWVGWAPDWP